MQNANLKFGLGVRTDLAIFIVSLAVLLAACGGGDADNHANLSEAKAADLKGDQKSRDVRVLKPAIDVSNAPTDLHRELAKLLPTNKALDKNSIQYAGWDAEKADLNDDDPKETAIPALFAEYKSAGYDTETDEDGKLTRKVMDYPQECKLFLLRGPERRGAELIEENIRAKLLSNGFGRIDAISLVSGHGAEVSIPRYARVDDAGDYDSVLVAYLKVVDDLVVYALESERPPKLGSGESRISQVSEGGGGSRVGGQLVSLLYYRLEESS